MIISKMQMDQLINDYKIYVKKIINHTYLRYNSETKDELHQVGLIGLWKGITAYYTNTYKEFDRKLFINTICAYIRYEMVDLLRNTSIIKISGRQWSNYVTIKKIENKNTDISQEQLKSMSTAEGLRYDWYIKTKEILNITSLDSIIDEKCNKEKYSIIPYYDYNIKKFIEMSYIKNIIDSAFAGVILERDIDLLKTWIYSNYSDTRIRYIELGKMYGLSSSMVGVIIERFISICRFVRDCEQQFINNSDGCIYFPQIKENNKTYNGKKIPGVKWVLQNRKWKVQITIGKGKSIFIGYFENYLDAVSARRDCEIKYRGKSNIEI